jgi:hypothetical protein
MKRELVQRNLFNEQCRYKIEHLLSVKDFIDRHHRWQIFLFFLFDDHWILVSRAFCNVYSLIYYFETYRPKIFVSKLFPLKSYFALIEFASGRTHVSRTEAILTRDQLNFVDVSLQLYMSICNFSFTIYELRILHSLVDMQHSSRVYIDLFLQWSSIRACTFTVVLRVANF